MRNKFIKTLANKSSISHRKLVHGVGINDAQYVTQPRVDGVQQLCPYYYRWSEMLKRCYSSVERLRHPTYIGCTVCDEWLTFSKFKDWMKKQEWNGMHLDKDIIKIGNKVYSPETCRFVSGGVNLLLTNRSRFRGKYPTGVSRHPVSGKFISSISIDGKRITIGRFDNQEDAESAYLLRKHDNIILIASTQKDKAIKFGLIAHARALLAQKNRNIKF